MEINYYEKYILINHRNPILKFNRMYKTRYIYIYIYIYIKRLVNELFNKNIKINDLMR